MVAPRGVSHPVTKGGGLSSHPQVSPMGRIASLQPAGRGTRDGTDTMARARFWAAHLMATHSNRCGIAGRGPAVVASFSPPSRQPQLRSSGLTQSQDSNWVGSVQLMFDARGDQYRGEAADRERLAAVAADLNTPQKHVWRARIILATAEGCGTPRSCTAPGCRSRVCGAGKSGLCAMEWPPAARQDAKTRSAAIAAGDGRPGHRIDAG